VDGVSYSQLTAEQSGGPGFRQHLLESGRYRFFSKLGVKALMLLRPFSHGRSRRCFHTQDVLQVNLVFAVVLLLQPANRKQQPVSDVLDLPDLFPRAFRRHLLPAPANQLDCAAIAGILYRRPEYLNRGRRRYQPAFGRQAKAFINFPAQTRPCSVTAVLSTLPVCATGL